MKKTLSVIVSLVLILSIFIINVYAVKTASIDIYFNDDIAGKSRDDISDIIRIESDSIVFDADDYIQVNDCVGNPYGGSLKAGRTYNIDVRIVAAPGCELPDSIENANLIKAAGCNVYRIFIADSTQVTENGTVPVKVLCIEETVTVRGSFIQSLFGKIADFFLRMRSWSPY